MFRGAEAASWTCDRKERSPDGVVDCVFFRSSGHKLDTNRSAARAASLAHHAKLATACGINAHHIC